MKEGKLCNTPDSATAVWRSVGTTGCIWGGFTQVSQPSFPLGLRFYRQLNHIVCFPLPLHLIQLVPALCNTSWRVCEEEKKKSIWRTRSLFNNLTSQKCGRLKRQTDPDYIGTLPGWTNLSLLHYKCHSHYHVFQGLFMQIFEIMKQTGKKKDKNSCRNQILDKERPMKIQNKGRSEKPYLEFLILKFRASWFLDAMQ